MGWGRTMLLGDVGTQMNVDDLEQDVRSLHDYLNQNRQYELSQADTIAQLTRDNHKLKLCVGTLVRILVAKNIATQEDLGAAADIIDNA